MTQRRVLLVDNDRAFHRLLSEQIGPYGFEVVPASPADPDVLGKVKELDPALLIIAVDEPDKVGYSLCNKAKKGVAAHLPVILATATVSPEGFANHRKLKIHADEYLDKRSLSPDEVLGKIDNLVGLGDLVIEPGDELQIPVEVEDLPLDLADAEVLEEVGEDGNEFADEGYRTSLAEPRVDGAALEDDLDGAFAAITDMSPDDAPPVPARSVHKKPSEPPPLPGRGVALPPVEELEVAEPGSGARVAAMPAPLAEVSLDDGPSDYIEDEPSMGIPEPIDMPSGSADVVEPQEAQPPWDGEVPEPIGDVDDGGDGGGDFDGEERTSAGGPPLAELLAAGSAAEAPVAPPPAPEPAPAADAGIDLGLEEVAARADAEQSGVHDRRTLQKIHQLERENAKLKGELEKARQGGEARTQGREREFLHLREMIATKDKEILELRDELVAKDRQLLDGKEKLRQLQHTKTQLEGKNLELEQRIVADADRVEAAESRAKDAELRVGDATTRLAAVEAKAKADVEAAQKALAERTAQATQLDRELSAARARLGDAEREHAEAIAQLRRERDAEAQALRGEIEQARAEAAAQVRAELGAQHARDLAAAEARHAETLAARDEAHGEAVAALEALGAQKLAEAEARHAAIVEALQGDAEAAVAAERAKAEEALAGERGRAEQAIAAERARADQAVSDAATTVQETTAAERARAEQAIAEAQARAQEDLVAVVAAHQGELDKARHEHEQAIAGLRAAHEDELAAQRARAVADRDRLVGEHQAAVAVLVEDRDRVQGELDELRVETERVRGELTAFAERSRREVDAIEQEKQELERGLSSARERHRQLEAELAAARQATEQQAAAVAERDQRIAQLKGELDGLEQENAGYQEQVLKAYQKIKADEATVARAKKAMAIALTLLDEEKSSEKTPG